MNILRRAALALLSAWLALPAAAADHTFVHAYDLAATAYVYCDTTDYLPGRGRIITVGSNTTVTTVGSVSGFGGLRSGDEVFVNIAGVATRRVVDSVTTSTTIVLTVAIDLSANGASGYAWTSRHVTCSTAATAGWLAVKGWRNKLVIAYVALETGTGGVDVSVECRGNGDAAVPLQVLTFNLTGTTAPTNGEVAPIAEDCSELRVGLQWGTADGAGPDSVTVTFTGEPGQ